MTDDAAFLRNRRQIDALIAVMARLRDPNTGCPWDLAQDFSTIAPYTIEEAYEVADAIDRGAMADLADELGDLLLQVVFHARMAEEAGAFAFPDVVEAIVTKMIRRHPHVFADDAAPDAAGIPQVKRRWEDIKAEERAAKGVATEPASLMDDVGRALPALMRATKLGKRAGRIGFDWPDAGGILDKVEEEAAELREAMAAGPTDAMREEVGDLLFTVAQLARKLDMDAEDALRLANAKFERRFRSVEQQLDPQERSAPVDADRLEALWQMAKARTNAAT
ncbi:nucleoside triphosphate pyrophosphohydrolase [Tistrella bauzanensis]|uniref:Nucleoside triphosphate pyrophosphohydrolase n=1 Tax=Tistrella bauzanensis TaxID=657419 RepID=A0ABQ1IF94_9PROT|nr:nucleoside triphosphate pyrophosphohydrolase [Tistrella bauzanensis]GGB38418.1 nucleoside triphosphate pyrophosphohydrolase [Tistrella bauzanensis]